jgi:hypothetical protein
MSEAELAGLRVLQQGGRAHRGGNLLLLDETPGREALLKVYRRRGTRGREASKRFWYFAMERKRGVTARERCALERRNLLLWRAEGFDVPALLERPLPEGFSAETAQWLEYCPGPLLFDLVRDAAVPLATRSRALARFARELAQRQGRALERGERALVMKHASIKHVLVHEQRQVSFDLESSYSPRFPMLDALADELGSYVRSLLRVVPEEDREPLGGAFFEAYAHPEQLAAIADFGLRHGGLSRAVRRIADRRRRKDLSEYDALCWVEDRLRA